MDVNNKHKAVLGVGFLVLIFIILAVWYMATHQAPSAFVPGTAQSTGQPPTSTALGPQKLTDSGQYYDASANYPGSTLLKQTAGAGADAAAVTTMKTFLAQEIDRFKTESGVTSLTPEQAQYQGLDSGRKYSFDAEYQTFQGSRTVSYVYQLAEDTGGAHPNAYYKTFTFNTSTGAQLSLADIFSTSVNYAQVLSAQSRKDLPSIISAKEGSPADIDQINQGTVANADNFANWYIDGSNLVLVFPPYQVGAYALGTVLDPIPLSKLTAYLKASYGS